MDRDLGLDLDRRVERQAGETDCGTRMVAPFLAEQVDDEIREAVDHGRVIAERAAAIDHAEDPQPSGDALEIAEFSFEAREHGECGALRRRVALFDGEVLANLAERGGERAIGVQRHVPGDVDAVAKRPNPGEGEPHTRRYEWCLRKLQTAALQSRSDGRHGAPLLGGWAVQMLQSSLRILV